MALPNIFSSNVCQALITRIEQLNPGARPKWGKMSAAQMLAHCNVTYEMIFENIHPKPGAVMRFIMKAFVKNIVVSEKPYAHNSKTAPQFVITDTKNFDVEQQRLVAYINKCQQLGESYFDGKASHSFGVLTLTEWNNMLYKHLEHHLTQFGV